MFEGLSNFRDFGGYATGDGRRLRTGLLYRSAHHGDTTDADLERLAGQGITAVVDLRRPDERQRAPSRRWAGFACDVIENDDGFETSDVWAAFMAGPASPTVERMRGYMLAYYGHAPLEARHLDLFSRYFEALERTSGAILIHCAAGKDRTGLLAALTHHLAGVSDADILHDYLLTNAHADYASRAPRIAQSVLEQTGRRTSEAAIVAALEVDEMFLRHAFEVMAQTYGSVDGYLEQALGVTPRRRAAILERLVDESRLPGARPSGRTPGP